jgi:hypothetical protein
MVNHYFDVPNQFPEFPGAAVPHLELRCNARSAANAAVAAGKCMESWEINLPRSPGFHQRGPWFEI